MQSFSKQAWVLSAMIGFTVVLAQSVRAADDVPNPQYGAWSTFKPGSSATLVSDSKVGPNALDVHVELTNKLVSVTPDAVTIEAVAKVDAMGHSNNPAPYKRDIKATAPAKEIKDLGTKDVEAGGKTYSCKVVEMTGAAAANNAANNSRAAAGSAKGKTTIYVSKDVPGGVVKMEFTAADDKVTTFLLKSVDVK